jgi:folate-binding protein YgfZ
MPTSWFEFLKAQHPDADWNEATGRIRRFGALEDEYAVLHSGAAIVDRQYAALIEIAGRDRLDWLHNLTTNHVKNLGRHEGNYTFVLNIQGRILFDAGVIRLDDVCWITLNRTYLDAALKHFEKYVIIEDVQIRDRSDDFIRLGLVGAEAPTILETLGLPQSRAMPQYGYAECSWNGLKISTIRRDYFGPFGVELFAPPDRAAELWADLTSPDRSVRAVPVGDEAAEIHRIEAGLPCPLREFAEDTLPAETRQLDRAVSFNKGCYLGQEVVERMRSRNVVARLLCALDFDMDELPPVNAELRDEEHKPVGKVTSACRSIATGRSIGLGYVKAALASPETRLNAVWRDTDDKEQACRALVQNLPQGPS